MKKDRDKQLDDLKKSLPARGAWIENAPCVGENWDRGVAPREGSVD